MGTVIAWVLVRDRFPGKAVVDLLIDLPFALPTIVAGLVLLALYGTTSPLHINRGVHPHRGVFVALLFVTLPFVVRTVQPVLLELDQDMEQAAHSLGADALDDVPADRAAESDAGDDLRCRARVHPGHRRIRLDDRSSPATCRARPQVAAVAIFGRIENDDNTGAAAISTVLLAIALVVLIVAGRRCNDGRRTVAKWIRRADRRSSIWRCCWSSRSG